MTSNLNFSCWFKFLMKCAVQVSVTPVHPFDMKITACYSAVRTPFHAGCTPRDEESKLPRRKSSLFRVEHRNCKNKENNREGGARGRGSKQLNSCEMKE